ncbi:arginine--tRNA ligase [Candidatus Daviesbacteria bacterium]|nr:arginine--tRNA ligase [Candidatus Daviesbacteria bacterium]
MYKQALEQELRRAISNLGFNPLTDIVLSISESPKFGDYTSNVALQLAKQKLKKTYHSSLEIANDILENFKHPPFLKEIQIAGPGFLNFFLKEESLLEILKAEYPKKEAVQKRYIVEYADPNTHKAFHIGHLRTLAIGESVSRLLEFEGNEVFRVNYGSDVGLSVAKALWGIEKLKDHYQKAKKLSLRQKAEFLGEAYAYGHDKYETDESAKKEIDEITKQLYQRDKAILPLWKETKEWSLAYFDSIYSRTGTEFDRRVNESEVDQLGKQIVLENIGKVFKKDQGAIIFEGEKYGLHNRVFINSVGNPTYEAKDIGLIELYEQIFPFDKAIILSDVTQASYHQVVKKAIELIHPHLTDRRHHLSFGFVSLVTGKMSSRTGNIITADSLIDQVIEEIKDSYPNSKNLTEASLNLIAVAAIKFSYLKYSISSDISLDIKQSISLQGDSGPYLLYAYARINSILNRAKKIKARKEKVDLETKLIAQTLEDEEREVLRSLEYFEIVVGKATQRYQPNEVANFLLNLAKSFNLFYEKYPVLGSDKEKFRLDLSKRVAETIKIGLNLLGIETVEKM